MINPHGANALKPLLVSNEAERAELLAEAEQLPSLLINSAAVLLCFLAALYPARRAAQLPPAEALRHE